MLEPPWSTLVDTAQGSSHFPVSRTAGRRAPPYIFPMKVKSASASASNFHPTGEKGVSTPPPELGQAMSTANYHHGPALLPEFQFFFND